MKLVTAYLLVLLVQTHISTACFRSNTETSPQPEDPSRTVVTEEEGVRCAVRTAQHNSSPPSALPRVRIQENSFVDNQARILLFHGFNSVLKSPPWYDSQILNRTRLGLYRDWGFNVVRLGVMWSGVMPEEGVVNHTYLDLIDNITKSLNNHGLYTILDLHQDVASTACGFYDGFPRWLVDKVPPPAHAYPWPFPQPPGEENWASGYLTEAAGHIFQCLYDNVGGMQDVLLEYWRLVARRFGGKTNILGYELMNEPWCGDIYKDPNLLLPGVAGSRNLLPMYDNLVKAIRELDSETFMFYEPVTFGVFLNGKYTGTGFDRVPGGPEHRNRSVLSYHYYCWLLGKEAKQLLNDTRNAKNACDNVTRESGKYGDATKEGRNGRAGDESLLRNCDSDPSPARPILPSSLQQDICDEVLGPTVFSNILKDVARTGGGSFLTEFGLCHPDSHRNHIDTVECEAVMNSADEHIQSWTYWDSQFFKEDGAVDVELVPHFARVYPRAVASKDLRYSFDVWNATFRLSCKLNDSIEGPTEIFLPKLHYPRGFIVKVSVGARWEFDEERRILSICLADDGARSQVVNMSVEVTPK